MSGNSLVTLSRLLLVAGLLSCSRGLTQDCALSGTVAWSKQVTSVVSGCDLKSTSPDGKSTVEIDAEGRLHLLEPGRDAKTLPYTIEPPAMLSWSPKSDTFFINDGQGSGMWSLLRVYRLRTDSVAVDTTVEREAVKLFRGERKCDTAASDPSVWGIGWSDNGTLLYLLIQATVNEPCGESGAFIGATVNIATGKIVHHLSESQAQHEFRKLLPPELCCDAP